MEVADLLIIWLAFFIGIMILALINSYFIDFQGIVFLVILVHIAFTMTAIMRYKDKLKFIFIGGFFARVFSMFWDLYAKDIFVLANSGPDAERFYQQAIDFSQNISMIFTQGGEIYSKINGLIFYLVGKERILIQYINVLLGLSIIFLVYKILRLLEIDRKIVTLILILTSFFPNSIVMSSIFLREIYPSFFVTASLYYFIKWFKKARYLDMLLTFIMLAIASSFHSGVIGLGTGYIITFLFYKKERQVLRFSRKTSIRFISIAIIISLGFILYGDNILSKFNLIDGINDFYSRINSRTGESAYLKNLLINNPIELLVFAPIKSFFFFTAPLPMDWRGIVDAAAFSLDSLLYLSVLVYLLKNRNKFGERKTLVIALVIMIFGAGLIFGLGVSNTGTAIRHRQKLIPIFLILLGVMMDGKKSKQNSYKKI